MDPRNFLDDEAEEELRPLKSKQTKFQMVDEKGRAFTPPRSPLVDSEDDNNDNEEEDKEDLHRPLPKRQRRHIPDDEEDIKEANTKKIAKVLFPKEATEEPSMPSKYASQNVPSSVASKNSTNQMNATTEASSVASSNDSIQDLNELISEIKQEPIEQKSMLVTPEILRGNRLTFVPHVEHLQGNLCVFRFINPASGRDGFVLQGFFGIAQHQQPFTNYRCWSVKLSKGRNTNQPSKGHRIEYNAMAVVLFKGTTKQMVREVPNRFLRDYANFLDNHGYNASRKLFTRTEPSYQYRIPETGPKDDTKPTKRKLGDVVVLEEAINIICDLASHLGVNQTTLAQNKTFTTKYFNPPFPDILISAFGYQNKDVA